MVAVTVAVTVAVAVIVTKAIGYGPKRVGVWICPWIYWSVDGLVDGLVG